MADSGYRRTPQADALPAQVMIGHHAQKICDMRGGVPSARGPCPDVRRLC